MIDLNSAQPEHPLRYGDLFLNRRIKQVLRAGTSVELKPMQFGIFVALMLAQGEIVSRVDLYLAGRQALGRADPDNLPKENKINEVVNHQVGVIRRSFGEHSLKSGEASIIETVKDRGYRLAAPAA